MNILICAYRDWAKSVYRDLKIHLHGNQFYLAETPEELINQSKNCYFDFIAVIGWSWKVPKEILDKHLVIGMHPSDLPKFAGGSPIQNQILAGIENSKATLFKLNEKFDRGEIIDKEDISLQGHLKQVLDNISYATTTLLIKFVRNLGANNVVYTEQKASQEDIWPRRKPRESKLENPSTELESFSGKSLYPMTCKELWNHIRCHEDPYPNAYFEDETGRLIIKHVEFEPKIK